MTDSRQQEKYEVAQAYKNMGQPVIKYPKNVEEWDALDAVKEFKPQVVVGSWITTYSPLETSYNSNPWGIKDTGRKANTR